MSRYAEYESNVLYPASIIGLMDAPDELKYKKYQQYEDSYGNRYLEENGRFLGLSFQDIEERYHLLEKLPQKGKTFIETFILRAKDSISGNIVATKTGPMSLLLREAEVMAKITHPNIAKFLGFAISQNTDPCLIIEWLPGGTLEDKLKNNGEETNLKWIASVINQTAGAINHTHDAGFLHGDIKPQNIMFNKKGQTIVIDFGNSFPIDESGSTEADIDCACTLDYAAPEQVALKKSGEGRIHIQSDVYSLAAITYKMLTTEAEALAKMFRDLFVEDKSALIPLSAYHQECLTQLKQKLLTQSLRRALTCDYKERHVNVEEFNSEIQDILA